MLNSKIKIYILGFITGAVIFASIGVVAYSLSAKDISFTPNNSNWQVDNIKDAIDDLYKDNKTNYGTYVKDDLVFDLNYKYRGALRTKNVSYDKDNGYIFNGNSAIYLDRYQNKSMTYEAYFKTNDSNAVNARLMSSAEVGGINIAFVNQTIVYMAYVNGNYSSIGNYKIENNIWYHVVATIGDDGMKLYLNNELIDSNNLSNLGYNADYAITMIGCESAVSSSCYNDKSYNFNGIIKYARVYGRALTEKEVNKNYNAVIND